MKKCYTCQTEKNEADFNQNKSKKDGLNAICKECSRKRSRQYYADNREKHIRVCGVKKKKTIAYTQQQINNLKKQIGCQAQCGETEPCCLDFHHLRDKDQLISVMIGHGCCWATIKKEIDKCAIVCSNCHRKIHAGIISFPVH
jgi:hypothetical protein